MSSKIYCRCNRFHNFPFALIDLNTSLRMFHRVTRSSLNLVVRTLGTQRNISSIGFVGLGNMGASMASNLLKNFANVTVFDLNAEAVNSLVSKGAKSAATIKEMAETCDAIVTMLPATKHVQGVLLGPDGVFENAKAGTIVIDCSTIDPQSSAELNAAAAQAGLRMLDGPVSGGVTGAAAGTLTFMVGGTATDLAAATAVFRSMGSNIVHCGEAGAGEITKLCNNLALGISMIGTSEALALGQQLGMDPAKLSEVMNSSTARCWSSDSYNPCPGVMPNVPSSKEYAGGFGSALMLKDLGLAIDAANGARASLPLGANAHQLYNMMVAHGHGGKDFSYVFQYIQQQGDKK